MRFPRRHLLAAIATAAALGALSPAALAETYPSRPVSIMVPYPAGGGTER